MIKAAFRYFFPKTTNQQRLPPLTPKFSSSRGEDVPPALVRTVRLLKGFGIARTDQDAMIVIRQNPGKSLNELLKLRPERRRIPRLLRARERLKDLWR